MSSDEELVHPGDAAAAEDEHVEDTAGDDEAADEVGALLVTLAKSVRAHQIYQANNPVYQRFVANIRQGFSAYWEHASALELRVEERAFEWQGHAFPVGEGRESLPFVFYKDGIRYLTFLPGFEEEVEQFLELLHRGRQAEQYGDDLITLLWEGDFAFFHYGYVDQLAESVDVPVASSDGMQQAVAVEELDAEMKSIAAEIAAAEEAGAPPPPAVATVRPEDFEETLYFLDDAEMNRLQDELDREWRRDVKGDVVNALLDRLEDPVAERQGEILEVIRALMPILLARGELALASNLVLELQTLLDQADVLAPAVANSAERIIDEMSRPAMLEQLLASIEQGAIDPDAVELGVFLNYLRPEALPFLIRATQVTTLPALRDRFAAAVEGIARDNVADVVALLHVDDPTTVTGAAKLSGRLKLAQASDALAGLLGRPEEGVRLAAVEALVALRSSATIEALLDALYDDNREVRIAAARGIGAMRYTPARRTFEDLLKDRSLRDADLTEKIALFEAYGAVAGAEGVPFLEKVLNGRSLIGGRRPSDMRACAARALGAIASPAAQAALGTAADDRDPLVRNAVIGARRKEVRQ